MGSGVLSRGTVFGGGDFEVVRPLDGGGTSTVYLCVQLSTGLRRAVKVLSPEVVVEEEFRRRFKYESQIGARIRSDHIAAVIASGVDFVEGAGDLPWIAMELLDGEDLSTRVARVGRLDHAFAREVFRQIGHALTAAHAVGVAHRDLKPANIFLAKPRQVDVSVMVKVLDFGFAKVRDTLSSSMTTMSFGTPGWMAPEQNEPGASGSASDVWALGLLAFFTLTGRYYWKSANQEPVCWPSVAHESLRGPSASASVRARELIHADPLPPGFDGWFARCVAVDPSARFHAINEALDALDQMLARSTARSATRRRRLMAVGAGLCLTVASAAMALSPRDGETYPVRRMPRSLVERIVNGCPEDMAPIAGASVRLGGVVRSVVGFCIDRHEVTTADYAACVDAGVCAPVTRRIPMAPFENVCNATIEVARDDHPINCVTRVEAEGYCAWRGRRLPRNSEWELAAVGSTPRRWPWGREAPDRMRLNACGAECSVHDADAQGYLDADAWPTTAPVGRFASGASPEGVMDLLGNVSEWVSTDADDPRGLALVRGTGAFEIPVESARSARHVRPDETGRSIGFRCAR